MGKMIYTAITSLDGFIEDEQGKFDWAEPKEDVHRYINKIEAQNEVLLCGRKLHETMVWWESQEQLKGLPTYIQEYGHIWRAAEKVVYSRTLKKVNSLRTTIKSDFDPNEVSRMKKERKGDIGIGGAELAGVAISHGLVDEFYFFIHPVVVGSGKPAVHRGVKMRLALEETKRFEGGVVLLHYYYR